MTPSRGGGGGGGRTGGWGYSGMRSWGVQEQRIRGCQGTLISIYFSWTVKLGALITSEILFTLNCIVVEFCSKYYLYVRTFCLNYCLMFYNCLHVILLYYLIPLFV